MDEQTLSILERASGIDLISISSSILFSSSSSSSSSDTYFDISYVELELDCTGTEVSVDYEFYFRDSTVDSDLILTVTNVTSTSTITRVSNNRYTGRLSLTEINNNVKPVITVYLSWVNDDTINDLDRDIDDDSNFLLIDFNATQYKG